MTMVSKYPLNQQVKERIFEIFLNTLAGLKTQNEVNNFLEQFLSPTEKVMLAKRLSIAVLLVKKYDIRSISKILKVSTKTVAGINIWIKHNKGGLYNTIQNMLEKEVNQKFWDDLFYQIGKSTISLTTGNWSERRRNLEKEKFKSIKPF